MAKSSKKPPIGSKVIDSKHWSKDFTLNYEPHRSFRYVVKLPAEFMCAEEAVQEVVLPSFTNCGCWFRNPWSDLEMRIVSFIGNEALPAFHKNIGMKNFEIVFEQLDTLGIPISIWKMKCAKIRDVEYGHFSYRSDSLHEFVVRFKVTDIIHEFVEVNAAK